jgi:transcriptional regulator with XRE-family HTH domain
MQNRDMFDQRRFSVNPLDATKPLTSAQIRAVFGENLRQLCARESSVSEVCREIGVNRTQFSRYLNGEAFPRPDLLLRICSYFGVDANILIRPIASDNRSTEPNVLAETFARFAEYLPGTTYGLSEQELPSGLYRIWRRSFMWPDYVFCTGCRIWREGPLTHWKAYEPTSTNLLYLDGEPTLPERRLGRNVVMRQYRGFALAVNQSVCFFSAPPDNAAVMRITCLRPGFEGIPEVLSGYCALVRGLQPGAVTVCGAVMEPLRVPYRELLTFARRKYFYTADELPSRLSRYMFETPIL